MWKLLKQLNKKEYLIILICFIFICIQVYLDLLLPDYMSSITTLVQSEGSAFDDILIEGSKMLFCAFGSLVSSIIVAAFASKIASNFGGRIREKLFDQVQNFSLAEINHFSTASLITRPTNDVTQVQNLIVMGLQVVVKAPIMAIWAILKIANKSWQWTGATGVAVIILLIVNLICILFAIPKFNKVQTLTDNVNKVARENLTGLSVVRAYNGEVEFKNVSFKYPDAKEYILKNVSFKAKQGDTVAFIGSTGSGKSTLINLIPRFYDVTDGEVLVDGVNFKNYNQKTLRNKLGYISQKAVLFKGTIKENLVYCTPNVSDETIIEACKAVGLHHYIQTLPNGYDTVLNDSFNLSQGQKQQLTIARAMIADKPMLILDEATSSVDTRTELIIQNAMDKLMENRTSFVIAHRLSTIKNADLILVMNKGDIIEKGKHDE